MHIDDRIKQTQRRGAGKYVLGALLTLFVVTAVLSWLFLVQAYAVIVGPNDASPTARLSLASGTAWISNNTVYTLGGSVLVDVSADTFETTQISIKADSPSNIEVVLEPSPALISATIDLDGETSWYANGDLFFVGNDMSHKIEAGSYTISARNPYYEPWEQTLSLARAQQQTLSPRFEAVKGSIDIQTSPAGASIFIDGQLEGTSPLKLDLQGGEYLLSSKLKGFEDVEDTLRVSFQQNTLSRNYLLRPIQARVQISATPSDGVLLINNLEKSLGEHALDANTPHSVVYQKPGYFPFTQSIRLAEQEQKSLNIQLQPELGKVKFISNLDAELSINGRPYGTVSSSPRVIELPAKATEISIAKPGYRTKTARITPSSKRELLMNTKLLTEFEARRQEGRPLVATQLGINLFKFSPDAFTMGSPPNETGRRRNEHPVKVDFTRDFWVSEHEITQAQFAASPLSSSSSQSTLPVTDVTWEQAALFTNWLSEQEGLPVFYKVSGAKIVGYHPDSPGYRLPTEAEWEWLAKKAKRARSTVFVWGDQTRIPSNSGNFADQSAKSNQLIVLDDYDDKSPGLAKVGSFKADRLGLHDLAGNVSEWVHDFYTNALPDTDTVQIDYMGAARGTQHVVKGANYTSGRLRELRAAYREVGESAKPTIGFRIARFEN